MVKASKLAVASAAAVVLQIGGVQALEPYRWTARPLLVFAPSESSAALAEQRRAIGAARGGVGERDMVVVWIVGNRVSADGRKAPAAGAEELRRRYGVPAGSFRAILIGKDGGVKRASSAPIPAASLFQTIDAMPMRRDEMRRR